MEKSIKSKPFAFHVATIWAQSLAEHDYNLELNLSCKR